MLTVWSVCPPPFCGTVSTRQTTSMTGASIIFRLCQRKICNPRLMISPSSANTNVLSNVTCSGKKAFGPGAMGLYLEGHPRQPLRLLIVTVWAWDDFHDPTLPVPQSSFPSRQSKCNIDKGVCISSAGRRTSGCRTGSYPSTPAEYLPAPAAPPPVGALPTGPGGRNPNL